MTGMGSHESGRANTTTWLTPLEIVQALGSFDLDPCGYPGWPTADRLIVLPEDGLAQPWNGRVWLNPPYGRDTWRWLQMLARHGQGTDGFHEQAWGAATAALFLRGRLHFHLPDGTRAANNAGAPSVLLAYGERDAQALSDSGLPGVLVRDWRRTG